MGPPKSSKPNPNSKTKQNSPLSSPVIENSRDQSISEAPPAFASTQETTSTLGHLWYAGTWPRRFKAAPVTRVATESISAKDEASPTSQASTRDNEPRPKASVLHRSLYLPRSRGSSSRSLPLAATTTKLNITSDTLNGRNEDVQKASKIDSENRSPHKEHQSNMSIPTPQEHLQTPHMENASPSRNIENNVNSHDAAKMRKKGNGQSSGWLTWFSKPASLPCQDLAIEETKSPNTQDGANGTTDQSRSTSADNRAVTDSHGERRKSDPGPLSTFTDEIIQPRSWLNIWSYAGQASDIPQPPPKHKQSSQPPQEAEVFRQHSVPPPEKEILQGSKLSNQSTAVRTPKSTNWIFWLRNNVEDGNSSSLRDQTVADPASTQPIAEPENTGNESIEKKAKISKKREGAQSLDQGKGNHLATPTIETERGSSLSAFALSTKPTTKDQSGTTAKEYPRNLLLPSLESTYQTVTKPSLLRQLVRLLQYNQAPDSRTLHLVQPLTRLKKALAIGVHGYFPAPLIRSVLGQPTGTSLKFANSAATAIRKWTQSHGYSCEIEEIALEGEGKIADRVDLLWKLMLNWIESIRKADLVMIACHSQGVPVALMLIAKLIGLGCVDNCRIGVCAMAGVNLGPFADYKSRWISGSAGELFEFARSESQVSKDYEAALDIVLKFGAKIVYIGSLDDQLVSLASSTFDIISHPGVFRAVFIDGRIHAPDFLSHLVGLALKLRNLGITDHGLIRELSSPLAGSLYSGEGHSRIYDDTAVYNLAVQFTLETSSAGIVPMKVQREGMPNQANPYILPFAMRGVLEEEYVRTQLSSETSELLRQFDDWKPSSKVLKDVKFRLEGVRSKM